MWCIFHIIDDKSEMTDVLCTIVNHLKHNINVDSKDEMNLLNKNVKWIKKCCKNNTLIDGSIEINYQSKMISKMQYILEQCRELEINFFNAKDVQIKIERLLSAMNALFDVFDRDRKITKMKQKANKIY